jgi:methionyl-tRNA formyltransferase
MMMNEKSKNNPPFIFFGTGPIAVLALSEMELNGLLPSLIVTAPEKPVGRGRILTPSPVSTWAQARQIEIMTPEDIDELFLAELWEQKDARSVQVFLVIDYGKILPKRLLEMPERGVLNMHPSLLPRLRGPSPIRSAILADEKSTGVTVMLLDEKMDHGPIIAQRKVSISEWPPRGRELDEILAKEGGKLVSEILPLWVTGEIESREQNHDVATYCKIFLKEDGLLDLSEDPYKNLLKIRAFDGWPGTYTFMEKNGKQIRVQILDAHIAQGKLIIDRVKPEGRNEMSFADFSR